MAKRKPGRYDGLLHKLKPLPEADQSRAAKVQARKADITNADSLDGTRLAKLYHALRQKDLDLNARLWDNQLSLDAVWQLLLDSRAAGDEAWGQYGASDRTIRLIDGTTIRMQPEPYTIVKDAEAVKQWLKANGQGELVKETFQWGTLNALVKERLLLGEAEPDGCEAFVVEKPVWTPMKPDAIDPATVDAAERAAREETTE